ncbi:MAG: methyltransferase small [Actinomycetia bacterium]|nr:methyltransferase small [Actinomycetes bacterium]
MAILPHYYDQEPATPSAPERVRLALPDVTLDLATDRGVFSRGDIDPGTKLLLLEAPAPAAAGDALDLGCGYGPIALTLASRAPGATVWAVDVNRRALGLTEANATAHGLSNVRVAEPDEVPDDVRFTTIWSNPPIRVGKPALHELLRRWLPRLAPDGRAVLVVQKHLGADSLARWLTEQGFTTTRLQSRAGYRLLEITAT